MHGMCNDFVAHLEPSCTLFPIVPHMLTSTIVPGSNQGKLDNENS